VDTGVAPVEATLHLKKCKKKAKFAIKNEVGVALVDP